jgi:hypothetical protein
VRTQLLPSAFRGTPAAQFTCFGHQILCQKKRKLGKLCRWELAVFFNPYSQKNSNELK